MVSSARVFQRCTLQEAPVMKKIISVAAIGSVFLLGCSKPPAVEEPVRAVKTITVGADSFAASSEYTGEVRAQVESRLAFRVGGKMLQRQAELGQSVKAGQVLARLDPQDYKLAADAARAQTTAALTNRDLASADFARYKDLLAQNFISRAELDRREATLKSAQAQLEQAQAQLASQSNQSGYAVLASDVAGVVTAVEAEAGQVVSAGMTVFKIAADGARDVVFTVPDARLAAMRVGLPVKVLVWPLNTALEGKVREVAASADPATRTYQIKASLNAGQKPPALGSTVTVKLVGAAAESMQGQPIIKLPIAALRKDGQNVSVWVVDPVSMAVRAQDVQVATADGNLAVITGGLTPGMQVVSAGVHVLTAGQKVRLYQPPAAAATSVPAAAPIAAVPTPAAK
jgi:RND family efflux transporter MFP subunit